MSQPITITVFGSSAVAPGTPEYEQAKALGSAIAAEGWTLCNGGYGGTMAGAAEGARQAGGHVVGVTCSILRRSAPNGFIDEEVVTDNLLNRMNALVERGDAYVVLPGGTGTMLELAYVWELVNKGLGDHKPIILLGDFWRGAIDAGGQEHHTARRLVHQEPTVESVIDRLKENLPAGAARPERTEGSRA
jgi:uncharacterized protein (TIGR00730 family)